MQAILCSPPGIQIQSDLELPAPAAGESLVRVRMAGICRTDLELTRGYMGFSGILGHEFVGEIADSTSPLPQGTRVVGEINAGCGECDWCARGLQRHCPNRSVLGILNRNGCMAEQLSLPHENLLAVPETLDDETAVFVEPVAAALEIYEQLHLLPTDRVCILGDGKLGLLITMVVAHRQEIAPLLIGRHEDKLELVRDRASVSLERSLASDQNGQWDVVIDATGSSQGLQRAMELVRPRGTIVLKSTMANAEAVDLTPVVINEVTVLGSRCGQFAPALQLLTKHDIPVKRLIEKVYPLAQAEVAWQHATQRGAKKVLIQIADE